MARPDPSTLTRTGATARIRAHVLALPPGAQFRSTPLADEFETSVASVHNAIATLRKSGVIQQLSPGMYQRRGRASASTKRTQTRKANEVRRVPEGGSVFGQKKLSKIEVVSIDGIMVCVIEGTMYKLVEV